MTRPLAVLLAVSLLGVGPKPRPTPDPCVLEMGTATTTVLTPCTSFASHVDLTNGIDRTVRDDLTFQTQSETALVTFKPWTPGMRVSDRCARAVGLMVIHLYAPDYAARIRAVKRVCPPEIAR